MAFKFFKNMMKKKEDEIIEKEDQKGQENQEETLLDHQEEKENHQEEKEQNSENQENEEEESTKVEAEEVVSEEMREEAAQEITPEPAEIQQPPHIEEVSQENHQEEMVEEVIEVTIEEKVIVEDEIFEEKIVVEETVQVEEKQEDTKKGFFAKLKAGLDKTRKGMTDMVDDLFNNYGEIDDDLYEELEEILIMADVGMDTTLKIVDNLKSEIKERKVKESSEVKAVFKDVLISMLDETNCEGFHVGDGPTVVMVIGVNGVGKTTSIGKIAYNLKSEGKSVVLAAGDTFRAAAIDQLKVWADRADVNIIHGQEGGDPASIVYDAVQSAKSRNVDVLICDTAGRLHNKKNLMNELEKVNRIVDREYPDAKRETLLVLDATTGQNAVVQAKMFSEVANITGIVLTKLDGTAKGGVVLAINSELNIPVKLIGVGEGIDDLQDFDSKEFVEALLGE